MNSGPVYYTGYEDDDEPSDVESQSSERYIYSNHRERNQLFNFNFNKIVPVMKSKKTSIRFLSTKHQNRKAKRLS